MKKQLLAVALFPLFLACKKTETPTPPQWSPVMQAAAPGPEEFAYTSVNPFDSIGIRHNLVLDAVWNYVQQTGDTSVAAKKQIILNYAQTHRPEEAGVVANELANGPQKILTDINGALAGRNLQRQTRDLLDSLFSDIRQTTSLTAYENLIRSIDQLEAAALTAPLPGNERDLILQASAIAKYSAFFWQDKIQRYALPRWIKSIALYLTAMQTDTLGAIYGAFEGDAEGEAEYQSSLWTWYVDGYA